MENNFDSTESCPNSKSFSKWFDNFWYHYKWHSIVALILIFTVTICTFQTCNKTNYDLHVLYSGGHEINRKSENGNPAEYSTVISSFGRVTEDFDSDGEVNVTLKDLFMLSSDEINKIESANDGYEANYALLNENKEILRDTVMYSSYYVCFLSPAVYEEYRTIDGVEIFAPLEALVAEGNNVEYYSSSAVYLSSTGFFSLPGISSFPEDTLICLKNPSVFASHFNKKNTERDYQRGRDAIIKIINYK